MNINHNFQNVADSYLFSTIAKRWRNTSRKTPRRILSALESAM